MEVMELLGRCVLFPWEVAQKSGGWLDSDIMRLLPRQQKVSLVFKEQPNLSSSRLLGRLQAMAVPTLIAQLCNGSSGFQGGNNLSNLTQDEMDFLLESLQLDEYVHRNVLYLAPRREEIRPMVAYMTATYAMTMRSQTEVLNMPDLVEAAFQQKRDHPLIKEVRDAGLVILLNPLGHCPGVNHGSELIFQALVDRSDEGKSTVFMDVADRRLTNIFLDQKFPTRRDVCMAVNSTEVGQTRIGYFLQGPNTYITSNFIMEGVNERGRDSLW